MIKLGVFDVDEDSARAQFVAGNLVKSGIVIIEVDPTALTSRPASIVPSACRATNVIDCRAN